MTLLPRGLTQHGFEPFEKCCRCGTERPKSALAFTAMESDSKTTFAPMCADLGWCSRQAGVGLGKLDTEPKP